MKLRTLIIDDEPIALDKLKNYVGKVPFLELVAVCQDCFDAMEYLAANDVDLIVADINMPDFNGLDFIKSLSIHPMVIFTTAYSQYAVESYKVSAVDYLLKPYSFSDFQRAANKAMEQFNSKRSACQGAIPAHAADSLFIKVDYRYVRVSLSDIRYIKGYGEYLQVYVAGSETPYLTLSSFHSIKARLSENFLQVHRSYIVNMNQVEQIERNRVVMDSETYIPIGDSYKLEFQQYISSHAIGKNVR